MQRRYGLARMQSKDAVRRHKSNNEQTQLLKQRNLWVMFQPFSTRVAGVRDRHILEDVKAGRFAKVN